MKALEALLSREHWEAMEGFRQERAGQPYVQEGPPCGGGWRIGGRRKTTEDAVMATQQGMITASLHWWQRDKR